MAPPRRSILTTTGAAPLARGALRGVPTARAEMALPGEAQARCTSFRVTLHMDRFPPATALLRLAHPKAAGVPCISGPNPATAQSGHATRAFPSD